MTDEAAYVCTETPERMPARAQQVRQLAAGLLSHHRHERQVVLRFQPHLAELVDGFVADESSCCTFFGFAVDRGEQAVQLSVSAPEGAEALLASLQSVFGAGQGGGTEPVTDTGGGHAPAGGGPSRE